jgi:hypothetical protein
VLVFVALVSGMIQVVRRAGLAMPLADPHRREQGGNAHTRHRSGDSARRVRYVRARRLTLRGAGRFRSSLPCTVFDHTMNAS